MAKCTPKGHLSECKTWPIEMRNAAFRKTEGGISQTRTDYAGAELCVRPGINR